MINKDTQTDENENRGTYKKDKIHKVKRKQRH